MKNSQLQWNRQFEAAIKAHDEERLQKLMEQYALEVEIEKAKKRKENPYA